MEFDFEPAYECGVNIKVIGVGGGGCNAVNRMISTNIRGVEFVAVNTDAQVLESSCASKKLVIGDKITRGFGAGSNPEIGKRSAEESIEAIRAMLNGADMVFITAGMGGGTGTGAAPIIAKAAKELNILTVGIVTKPFAFEGIKRSRQAEAGIAELAKYVDSLIVIPNERLKQVEDTNITLANAFEIADDVLRRGVYSVSNLINIPGFVNLDFADVTTIMKDAGYAHMGVGSAKGADKAELAAMAAISSPLLETSIAGAMGVLVSITASNDIQLQEIEAASQRIYDEAHPDANIIWGASFDPSLEDEIRITIIATGFDNAKARTAAQARVNAGEGEVAPMTAEEILSPATIAEVEVIARELEAENVIVEEVAPEYEPAAPVNHEATIVTTIPSRTPEPESPSSYIDVFKCIKKKPRN